MAKLISFSTSKGQVTIPAVFRKKFAINSGTLLQFSEENGKIILTPLQSNGSNLRQYSKKEIEEFLRDDRISKSDANFFNKILHD